MHCPKCNQENINGSKFCSSCGFTLPIPQETPQGMYSQPTANISQPYTQSIQPIQPIQPMIPNQPYPNSTNNIPNVPPSPNMSYPHNPQYNVNNFPSTEKKNKDKMIIIHICLVTFLLLCCCCGLPLFM